TLGIPGIHQARNALAAAAVGLAFRVGRRAIASALESFRPASRRMEVLNLEGVVILNDTYNANPDSTRAALETLAAMAARGRRIAVLGDMLELGRASAAEHTRAGREAARLGIDVLLGFGTHTRATVRAAGRGRGEHFQEKKALAERLTEIISPGDVVLVKGSRGMRMEEVVSFVQERLREAIVPFG
ncbi:MAG: cyanophycin synthetase, partial [Bacteroidota bacterium]